MKGRSRKMPLANLKLLVRPNPGGLTDHRRFLAEEARRLGSSGKFSDLVMISEEGDQVHCHLSLVGGIFTRISTLS